MGQLKGKSLPPLTGSLRGSLASNKQIAKRPCTLQRAVTVVRFIVRAQLAARNWERHEVTGRRLAEAAQEMRQRERLDKMRHDWRAQIGSS